MNIRTRGVDLRAIVMVIIVMETGQYKASSLSHTHTHIFFQVDISIQSCTRERAHMHAEVGTVVGSDNYICRNARVARQLLPQPELPLLQLGVTAA